jgi:hypothetical protein
MLRAGEERRGPARAPEKSPIEGTGLAGAYRQPVRRCQPTMDRIDLRGRRARGNETQIFEILAA